AGRSPAPGVAARHRGRLPDSGLPGAGARAHARRALPVSAVNDVPAAAASLAPYAAHDGQSRGRRYPESPPEFRGEFQRDRDRIIHSNAFRRLVYKTQVFVNHEGDLYRTRVTHSIEVAQIARSVALALRLNEALTEAICLAHDLGHTPFGHAGQDALNECLGEYGGLEPNLQSLREVRIFRRQHDAVVAQYPQLGERRLVHETIRRMINHLVVDFIRTTQTQLERAQPRSIDEVRALSAPLAMLSDACREEHLELK